MTKPDKPARMTQAERTAISDARMYEAAVALIFESGTHNTTLKDIGERAGYSRGLASNRFGSKEALFGNLVTNFNKTWVEELGRFVGDRTGLPAYLAALDAVEDFLLTQSVVMKAMYILWYETISSHNDLRVRLAEHHAAYRRDAERWLREGIKDGVVRPDVDPALTAIQFCSFIFGTIYQWLVDPVAVDIPGSFRLYRQTSLETLAVQHRSGGRAKSSAALLQANK
ncbi:TetR/AcrR family transcriptional regulator [Sphingomonas sp. SUN019]|uniref:TetR/AcrR family transcriptional regulator n=1 Tax=Sphingomonas sp. SUN019 TaxID=2937788 RepID=UPI0021649647|nr:TetR/AcrR family transcriptional regulator [Sphingomonas sp. SUN019]UVO49719.1 TetR/AcrR family transcriptional regulator [Sphingomonas sp. SUN019]